MKPDSDRKLIIFIFGALFISCSAPTPDPESIPPAETSLTILNQGTKAVLTIPYGGIIPHKPIKFLSAGAPKSIMNRWVPSGIEDSLAALIVSTVIKKIPSGAFQYKLSDFSIENGNTIITFAIDSAIIIESINGLFTRYRQHQSIPIEPLFSHNGNPPTLREVESISLSLPCQGYPVPKQANLLPNAPRTYRNGIHRGIDFWADWGTPVRAVANGTVIRADHGFTEVTPDFRVKLLKIAHKTGHTPSDIFNHILLGRAVFIDHGFDLVPGYRVISIYAHLSGISKPLYPGVTVDKNQLIGHSGNSGIKDATLGERTGAHLHWELILQNEGGEYYLGQGLNYNELFPLLNNIFNPIE